ncbi:sugar ABC transporter permease [Candidatus Sumerlaeota bacterium]|nr:sugar ABC transporter permease [Candidatus Sumerlaeota bacterium]
MTSRGKRQLGESLEGYAYLLPAGIILIVFWYLPVIISFAMSFGNVTALMPLDEMKFVGARQYQEVLGTAQFQQSLWNTINYAIYSVPLTLVVALAAAMLLNQPIKGRNFWRTIYFLPYITTWVAISIVFTYLFHREYGIGNWLLNIVRVDLLGMREARLEWLFEPRGIWEIILYQPILGEKRGLVPPMWGGMDNIISGPSLSAFCIILTSVWRDAGYYMVIFLAGLQNIDKSLYEAASIDGATGWKRFRHITIPMLSPVTFFLSIISVINALKVFVPQFMMTPTGGPDNTTTPVTMYLYQAGFTGEWKLSYACAVAYVLTVIILALTIVQNKIFAKRVEYGH